MWTGFRQFILRGNTIDMAVAVVVGSAFGAVVTSLVSDLLTPLVAAVAGHPDFRRIAFTINGSTFRIGAFVNALMSFIMIAAAMYVFVVAPANAVLTKLRSGTPPEA